MKLCKDCKHFSGSYSHHSNGHCMVNGVYDYISGNGLLHEPAQIQRMNINRCGHNAKWFEPIEPAAQVEAEPFWKFWR